MSWPDRDRVEKEDPLNWIAESGPELIWRVMTGWRMETSLRPGDGWNMASRSRPRGEEARFVCDSSVRLRLSESDKVEPMEWRRVASGAVLGRDSAALERSHCRFDQRTPSTAEETTG